MAVKWQKLLTELTSSCSRLISSEALGLPPALSGGTNLRNERPSAEGPSKCINEIRTIAAELSPEMLRFGPVNPSLLWASSFCAPVYEQRDLFEMHVFGLRSAGHSIPLHDHPRMYGFIRPLHGRIRICTFSWLEPEEEQKIATERRKRAGMAKGVPGVIRRPAKFTGELILDGACKDPPIAIVEPNTANVHSIEALEDGAAFFDLLVPGYNDSRSCNYYTLSDDKANSKISTGDFVWLEGSEEVPREFTMQQLRFDPFLMSNTNRFD
ncbi:hypothetical protein niasHT_013445 [Heterodera trifolii]|uniref:2-aminoethanethiol dioxygenase n=1 Tax=Heterodera trifolii TaxID=157864 RepID=A0ABD2LCN0_9BILA